MAAIVYQIFAEKRDNAKIYLRLSIGRKRVYYCYSGRNINPKHWDEEGQCIKRNINKTVFNDESIFKIDHYLTLLREYVFRELNNNENPTKGWLKKLIKKFDLYVYNGLIKYAEYKIPSTVECGILYQLIRISIMLNDWCRIKPTEIYIETGFERRFWNKIIIGGLIIKQGEGDNIMYKWDTIKPNIYMAREVLHNIRVFKENREHDAIVNEVDIFPGSELAEYSKEQLLKAYIEREIKDRMVNKK